MSGKLRTRSSAGASRAAPFIAQQKSVAIASMANGNADAQLKKMRSAIMAACAKGGMDEDTRRDMFVRITGKNSLRLMSAGELLNIRNHVNSEASPLAEAAKSVQNKIYALWMSAYWLGQIDTFEKSALEAFCKRQTGTAKFVWLQPHQSAKVIEALKDICTRAGVDWSRGAPSVAVNDAIAFNLLLHRVENDNGEVSWPVTSSTTQAQKHIAINGAKWRAHLGKPTP